MRVIYRDKYGDECAENDITLEELHALLETIPSASILIQPMRGRNGNTRVLLLDIDWREPQADEWPDDVRFIRNIVR